MSVIRLYVNSTGILESQQNVSVKTGGFENDKNFGKKGR